MGTIYLKDLNAAALSPREMIDEAERRYHERVSEIADYVCRHEGVSVILLAGPSGSGKTTSANLIKDAIILRGRSASVISLDDFYRAHDDPSYPKNERGERDYECPDSLNLGLVEECLFDVIENRRFTVPKYDFKEGRAISHTEYAPVDNGCVIIEGLHALNPRIYEHLPSDRILKLFVSVSTNVESEDGRILSGRKMRFLRRLVRDSLYRGSSAEKTLSMWKNVLAAEDVYLYPYKADADLAFDTFHPFEVGVMKGFAKNLISDELATRDSYAAAVHYALSVVAEIDYNLVPDDSLIREFIPGGIYEALY